MNLKRIKSLVDEIGRESLNDYDDLFESEITDGGDGNYPRYSLKIKTYIPNENPEVAKTKLIVRIYTDHSQRGENCKEIGIVGKFVFDKLLSEGILFKNVYLTTSKGTGYGRKKVIVDHLQCPNRYDIFIDEPHFATILNFYDIKQDKQVEKINKFVQYYFDSILPSK